MVAAKTPQECLELYFTALHDNDGAAFDGMFSKEGRLLGIGPDGAVVCRDHAAFRKGALARGRSPELRPHDKVLVLRAFGDTLCVAKVRIALPAAPTSPTPTFGAVLYTDFVCMLRDGGAWRIIAKVYSSAALDGAERRVDPGAFASAARAVWDGYVAANRAADGDAMGRFFHPDCRLTFATDRGLGVVGSDEFCAMVGARWRSADHADYAHLRDDPKASARDTLPAGQENGAKIPTSKAPISVVFHSFRLIFGRVIISRNGLEA